MERVTFPSMPEDDLQQLLVYLMGHCEVIGRDASGRTILQIALDDCTLTRLLVFGTTAAKMRHGSTDTVVRPGTSEV